MKVILLKNAPKVGQKDDVVEVKPGYAMNFLIPNGFAVASTPKKEQEILKKKEEAQELEQKETENLKKELSELSKNPIVIKARANEKGHLFAGLGKKEIVEASGKNIPEKILDLNEEIKEIGEREVDAKAGDKTFKLKVVIEAE